MALVQAWTLQGATPTTIEATDFLAFFGAAFGDAIVVGAYNTTTHVRGSGGANDSSGNTPVNNKFISQTGGTGGDSQADWGGGTEDLDQILDAECALKLNVTFDTNITIANAILYGYDGTTPATAPTGIDLRLAEKGDANWTEAEGSAAALTLTDQGTPATSHDYFVAISVSPTTVGVKSANKLRFEFEYQ